MIINPAHRIASVVGLALTTGALSAPQYTSTPIMPPVGHTGAFVQRLNDAGQVAGISGIGDDFSEFTPFIWSASAGAMSLPGGQGSSWVYDLNNSGAVLAFNGAWSGNGEPMVVGDGHPATSTFLTLDDEGRAFGSGPVFWSSSTGLITIPSDTPISWIVAANNKLQAIGERSLITPDGVTPLPTPSFAYSDEDFYAYDISDTGMVVGEAIGPAGLHGVVWLPDGSIIDLGIGNMPAAVNDLGEVAGYTFDQRNFLWSAQDGFTWLDADNGLAQFGQPMDINNTGQILFSRGANEPAWLLTPIPAPGVSVLVMAAGLAAARRKRR